MWLDPLLQQHLPQTLPFTPERLWQYTEYYSRVLLKPSGGGGGAGIIQVAKRGNEQYQIHAGKVRQIITGREQTVHALRALFRPKMYLLQPYLSLGRIEGRPFDVRIMLQRKSRHDPWVITGWLAKLAGPGFIVTNIQRSRGKVLPLETAIRRSNIAAPPQLLDVMRHVSMGVANCLGQAYPTLREIGLDMGIDTQGKPWIIEANFRPSLSLFRQLPNRAFYKRIKAMRQRKAGTT